MKLPPWLQDAPLCPSGKRPFPDEHAARAHLASARHPDRREQRKPGRVERTVYACPCCGCWHLSAMTERRPRRGAGR